jgi:class 3 adenylate cyclase
VARLAADELEDVVARYPTKALRASAVVGRGAVQLAAGDPPSAAKSFDDGVRLWHELGAPFETARARMGLAEAYRAIGNPERAALELEAARSAFERLGAKLDVRKAARSLGETARPTAGARRERVFMFTDIVKSTNLVELIGDEAWGHLVRWHNETLASLIVAHAGEVVRTMGDGFFVTFETPGAGVECAVAIQEALEEHRRRHGFSPWVRIGLHRADATEEGSDWSGVGVHAAARIGALARAEEIVVSRETAEAAGGGYRFSAPRSVSLKGISEPIDVVTVEWR